mgnify:CR=1 FL=1
MTLYQLTRENIIKNRGLISLALGVICVLIIIYAISGFNENQKHDGMPNLLVSVVSYGTTTLAVIIALLFLIE